MARKANQEPTQAVFLPYEETRGEEAAAIYEKSGRKAQIWQRKLLLPLLTVNEEGLWTHTKFGYALPRRNGKNEVVIMRELYALMKGESVLHTAHRTSTSHSAWERRKCRL